MRPASTTVTRITVSPQRDAVSRLTVARERPIGCDAATVHRCETTASAEPESGGPDPVGIDLIGTEAAERWARTGRGTAAADRRRERRTRRAPAGDDRRTAVTRGGGERGDRRDAGRRRRVSPDRPVEPRERQTSLAPGVRSNRESEPATLTRAGGDEPGTPAPPGTPPIRDEDARAPTPVDSRGTTSIDFRRSVGLIARAARRRRRERVTIGRDLYAGDDRERSSDDRRPSPSRPRRRSRRTVRTRFPVLPRRSARSRRSAPDELRELFARLSPVTTFTDRQSTDRGRGLVPSDDEVDAALRELVGDRRRRDRFRTNLDDDLVAVVRGF